MGEADEALPSEIGPTSELFAEFRITRSALEEERLTMRLPAGDGHLTPGEITAIWEGEWGVYHADQIRFEAPAGAPSRYLNPRSDIVPCAPSVVTLSCRGRGSVLTALAVAFRQHGHGVQLLRQGDVWEQPKWNARQVQREHEKQKERQLQQLQALEELQTAGIAPSSTATRRAGGRQAPPLARPEEVRSQVDASRREEPQCSAQEDARGRLSERDRRALEEEEDARGRLSERNRRALEEEEALRKLEKDARGRLSERDRRALEEEEALRKLEKEESRIQNMSAEQLRKWKEREARQEQNRKRREERERNVHHFEAQRDSKPVARR